MEIAQTVTIDGIPVYDALITDENTGMFKISLVDDPAVMQDFLAFDRSRRPQMYSVADEEKRLVRGVVMRADFPIYRCDAHGEYYVVYKAGTIRQMAEKYLAESRQNDVNLMHQGENVDGVQLVQWFIKGDGVSVEGFDECADGSLFGEFHIISDEIWEAVKAGTYKGFSLEGVFDMAPERSTETVQEIVEATDGKFSKTKESMNSKITRIKAAIARILAQFGSVTTDKGILYWDGDDDLAVGMAVYHEDDEGNRIEAGDGEYVTEDEKVIVVVEGKVAEIRDPEAEVAPEEPAEEPDADDDADVDAARVATDKGELVWEGEGELAAGTPVFVENEGELSPAPDGEYVVEDGKVIVVVDGLVAEIRDPEAEVAPEEAPAEEELRKENASLKEQIKAMKAELSAIKRQSAAKPAHEEVVSAGAAVKTGNKGLDNLARYFNK